MKIILNEKKVVEDALKYGKIDNKKPTTTIRLLIKYFYSQGKNKDEVRSLIEDFMKNNYKGFNIVKWNKQLDRMVKPNKYQNYDLFVVDDVLISKNEIKRISNIQNYRLEKIAFILLAYAKIYNQMNKTDSNWVNSELKDIFSDAKIAISSESQAKMIYKLKELGLVDVSKKVDCTNIKVLFVDSSIKEEDILIRINNFKNFIYEYCRLKGEKIIECSECGCLIKKTSGTRKYCKECGKKKRKENVRKNVKNFRKKNQM